MRSHREGCVSHCPFGRQPAAVLSATPSRNCTFRPSILLQFGNPHLSLAIPLRNRGLRAVSRRLLTHVEDSAPGVRRPWHLGCVAKSASNDTRLSSLLQHVLKRVTSCLVVPPSLVASFWARQPQVLLRDCWRVAEHQRQRQHHPARRSLPPQTPTSRHRVTRPRRLISSSASSR